MTWEAELEELRRREALAEQLGGVDKVERQHHSGKLTVRDRIDAIVDPRDTRPVLCDWVRLARRTLRQGPPSWGYPP